MSRPTNRPLYAVTLRPLPGVDGIRALRAALKAPLRKYRLQALEISEIPDGKQENDNASDIKASTRRAAEAGRRRARAQGSADTITRSRQGRATGQRLIPTTCGNAS
jgi:hypothetical protein